MDRNPNTQLGDECVLCASNSVLDLGVWSGVCTDLDAQDAYVLRQVQGRQYGVPITQYQSINLEDY